jgi:hypothetical protein
MTQEAHRAKFRNGLQVHRLTPGSAYSIDGCVTLCIPCHSSCPKRPYGSLNLPYRTVLVDSEVIPLAKAAALLEGKHYYEWLSDLVNEASAKSIGRKPLKRKPPKPRPKRD